MFPLDWRKKNKCTGSTLNQSLRVNVSFWMRGFAERSCPQICVSGWNLDTAHNCALLFFFHWNQVMNIDEPKCLKVYVVRLLEVKTKVWCTFMCITFRSMTGIRESAWNIAVHAVSWSTWFPSFIHQYRQIYFRWLELSMANHHVHPIYGQ